MADGPADFLSFDFMVQCKYIVRIQHASFSFALASFSIH